MYSALARRQPGDVPAGQRSSGRHRLHALALVAPYIAFPLLYALSWNPIYPGIAALAIGAGSTVACRPELGRKTLLGGLLFLVLYAAFMVLLVVFTPGYIERVWNLGDLSGVLIAGIPLEELAFGFAFGTYWSGLYEHFSWRAIEARTAPTLVSQRGHHG
jgi:energy-coupling factor transporter transmembrane protein EcfT